MPCTGNFKMAVLQDCKRRLKLLTDVLITHSIEEALALSNKKEENMKTKSDTFYLLLLILVGWGMASCESFLSEDPKGQLATENFFTNQSDLEASLNALYRVVADTQHANHYNGTNFLVGDDISTHPASNKQPLREHDQFAVSDNNAWMPYLWEQRYRIFRFFAFQIYRFLFQVFLFLQNASL